MNMTDIILRIRAANTVFGDKVAGAAEFAYADANAIKEATQAFVVHESDDAGENELSAGVQQEVTERFTIYASVVNDTDETGHQSAIDKSTIREQLLSAINGWIPPEFNEPIEYRGSSTGMINRAFATYEFRFAVRHKITESVGYTYEPTDEFLTIEGRDDIVLNGDFATSDYWTLGTGWTISAGKARCFTPGVESDISQALDLVQGRLCKVKVTTSGVTQGSLTPILGGNSGTGMTDNGEKEQSIVVGTDDSLIVFRASSDFIGSIDDVQVMTGFGIDIDGDGEAEAEFNIDLRS